MDANNLLGKTFAPDLVNTLENSKLNSAIRAELFSPGSRNSKNFLRTFLDSSLIVLIDGSVKIPDKAILNFDEEGFAYYPKCSKVPLVQLNDQSGFLLLPAFTESKYVQIIEGLAGFTGLVVSSMSLLEMFVAAGSRTLIVNPGSKEQLNIEGESINEMLDVVRRNGVTAEFVRN